MASTDTTTSASGSDPLNTAVSSGISSAASGALASSQLGTANTDQGAAVGALTNIQQLIAGLLAPNLSQYAQPLAQLAFTNEYNPDDVIAAIQQVSAENGIQIDPQALAAQRDTLEQYQQIAEGSGFTPIERAGIAQSQNLIQTQNQGAQGAIEQQNNAQGQGGVTNSLAARLITQQGNNTAASLAGGNIAAAGQQRAIDALSGESATGGNIANEESNLAVTKGAATNSINALNTQLKQQAATSNQSATTTAEAQQQNLNNTNQIQNVQNQYNEQGQQITAANQGFANELNQTGEESQLAGEEANVDTAFGVGAQKAGYTNAQNSAASGATSLSSLYSAATKGGSGSSSSGSTAGTTDLGSGDVGATESIDEGGGIDALATGGTPGEDGKITAGNVDGDGDVEGEGTETSDSIPVHLSNKEYVIKAESAEKLGKPALDALNSGDIEKAITCLDDLVPRKKPKRSTLDELSEEAA